MKNLLLLLFLSTNIYAQIHKQLPLPQIEESSVKIIDEGIIGWSKSLDGQWISEEMTIPARAVSQDEEFYETEESQLGMDNIYELHLYEALYGEKTINIFIKISHAGYYKYPATQQKWQSIKTAYYYVFEADQLKKLSNIGEEVSIVKIPLLDYGSLGEVKTKNLIDELKKQLVVREGTDRLMVTILKTDTDHPDKIYFQISSQHVVFPDVEGVYSDFLLQGRSIYGLPQILDYLHYDYSKEAFLKFFSTQ